MLAESLKISVITKSYICCYGRWNAGDYMLICCDLAVNIQLNCGSGLPGGKAFFALIFAK